MKSILGATKINASNWPAHPRYSFADSSSAAAVAIVAAAAATGEASNQMRPTEIIHN